MKSQYVSIAAVLGSRNVINLLLRGGGGKFFLPAAGFRGAIEKYNKNKRAIKEE